jgi:hypothetical protein
LMESLLHWSSHGNQLKCTNSSIRMIVFNFLHRLEWPANFFVFVIQFKFIVWSLKFSTWKSRHFQSIINFLNSKWLRLLDLCAHFLRCLLMNFVLFFLRKIFMRYYVHHAFGIVDLFFLCGCYCASERHQIVYKCVKDPTASWIYFLSFHTTNEVVE